MVDLQAIVDQQRRRRLDEARVRLRREALRLPPPWHAAVLAEIESRTDVVANRTSAIALDALEQWSRYDVATGTIDGEQVGYLDCYEDQCREALGALRLAIEDLKKAKREPGHRRVSARRRLLTARKAKLLVVLFRFGRRRIEHSEVEWRSEWDGAWKWKRWREIRTSE